MAKERLTTVVHKLKAEGREFQDENIIEIAAIDARLGERFGDVAKAVWAIRDQFSVVKYQLDATPLQRLHSVGVDIELDEQKVEQLKVELIHSVETRAQVQHWLERIEEEVIIPELVEAKPGRIYKTGGMKSPEGINRQLSNPLLMNTYHSRMRDVTRGRIICDDLSEVVDTGKQILQNYDSRLWGFLNYYDSPIRNSRGIDRFHFAYHGILLFDPFTPFELQTITKRAEAISRLNHPILRRRTVSLDEDHLNYVKALTWGSHLLDYEEYLRNITHEL